MRLKGAPKLVFFEGDRCLKGERNALIRLDKGII